MEKLTFGELTVGQRFIAFPTPEDYKTAYFICIKINRAIGGGDNAIRVSDGLPHYLEEKKEVIAVG